MKIYVDEMPIKVRQRVLYYDDGKTNCVELEFTENVKPTKICNTQSLKQQERREMVKEIRQLCEKEKSNDLIKGLTEQCEQLKQSQKQLAISELENLKQEFNSRKLEYKTMENSFHIYGLRIERIFQIIDDQIKELKGE